MPLSDTPYDNIIIGAGHNGLTCAGMLARAGRKVLVLEASDDVGGAARTMEFTPGFRVSHVAHLVSHLLPEVISQLDLESFGLEFSASNISTIALSPKGNHLCLSGPFGARIEGNVSLGEQLAWVQLREKLLKFSAVLAPALSQNPPRLKDTNLGEKKDLLGLGLRIRKLGQEDMREFLRMALTNVADALEDELTDDRLMGAIALDAVLGTHSGPRSPNSLMSLYNRIACSVDGQQAALALPKGGMGTISQALAKSCIARGVKIKLSTPVEKILVEKHRAAGVLTKAGQEFHAKSVISALNPKTTILDLAGAENFDTGFVRKISNIRMRGNAAKLHLALTELPKFTGLSEEATSGRLVIAPGVDYVERAFNPSKYGAFSPEPVMEIIIPSQSDPSFAPKGKHVLSATVQFAPSELKSGWGKGKARFLKTVMKTLEAYAPGVGKLVEHSELLTPADLEAQYGMIGGHWHHGELALDQMFMLRPVPEAAQYETPLEDLWLCGAGSHPGGNVMGAAGMNAAQRILKKTR